MTSACLSGSGPRPCYRSDVSGTGHAIIVGASLAGLMTALTLSRAGLSVTMLERSAETGRTGAALHVGDGLVERITGQARGPSSAISPGVQTWFTLHAGLRAAVDADPAIVVHQQSSVETIGQDTSSACATTDDGRQFQGDILIGADGYRSVVRRSVSPEKPDAVFAGYLIWLGVSQEAALGPINRWPTEVAMLGAKARYLLGYPLPGHNGSTARGRRQLGWALYDSSRNRLLRDKGCLVGNVVTRSLRAADIPDRTYSELTDECRRQWPEPWRRAMLECIERRAVIGTPITEYVPDRLVNGRLALVGDAAHVPTPITGNGFSASLSDAEALAKCVAQGIAGSAAEMALWEYETARLNSVRSLVQAGQQFSRSFASCTDRSF